MLLVTRYVVAAAVVVVVVVVAVVIVVVVVVGPKYRDQGTGSQPGRQPARQAARQAGRVLRVLLPRASVSRSPGSHTLRLPNSILLTPTLNPHTPWYPSERGRRIIM